MITHRIPPFSPHAAILGLMVAVHRQIRIDEEGGGAAFAAAIYPSDDILPTAMFLVGMKEPKGAD